MTEIKIQRKKRPIWPWILALVLVGLIIWLLSEYSGNGDVDIIESDTLEINMTPVEHYLASQNVAEKPIVIFYN